MANTTFSEHDTDAPTVEVEWGGRTFSPELDARRRLRPDRIRKLLVAREQSDLPVRFSEALRSRLVWDQLSAGQTNRTQVVEAYVRSLSQLAQCRQDVEDLARYACLANLEFRQSAGETDLQARDLVLSAKLDEMLAQAACDWRPLTNILDESLISLPMPLLRDRLDAALTEAIAEFTQQFFELLAKLVDRTLFGLVEWLPEQSCHYFFFRCVVIQENEGPTQGPPSWLDSLSADPRQTIRTDRITENAVASQRITESRFQEPTLAREGQPRVIGRRTTTEVQGKGKHYHRLARHEHFVIDALRTTVGNSRVVMPPEVKELVEHIPKWLYPFIQVIDGKLCREQVIERDTRVDGWVHEVVRDEPIFGCEPAVILGPYVLTGWGPREVDREVDRRQTLQTAAEQEQAQKVARRRAPWMITGAAALGLVAVLLSGLRLPVAGVNLVVLVMATVALAAAWQAAKDRAVARRLETTKPTARSVAYTIGWSTLILIWLYSLWVIHLSWETPVAMGLLLLLAYFFGRGIRFILHPRPSQDPRNRFQ